MGGEIFTLVPKNLDTNFRYIQHLANQICIPNIPLINLYDISLLVLQKGVGSCWGLKALKE